jgi:outer membrane protein assembly factor BamD (BamD/ComL family)
MKKAFLISTFILLIFSVSAFGQEDDKNQVPIDSLLEQDAKHNLNVAWQYFKLKKAYKAVLMRTEETIAAHPTFSKMDEVLYLSGMSSYYLAEGKGKQKINPAVLSKEDKERYNPKRLREDALALLSQLVESHPDSKYAKKAEKTIKSLKPKE